jgi:excinuclease ABC subunit C
MRRLETRLAEEPENTTIRLPDLIVVDGGKGQLSMACQELRRLGLEGVPIIGLAKEFEEIHRPGEAGPLRLPEDCGALRLLQRIRDEAHRFANGYHSLLLKKRMTESLRTFGSIERLKKAGVEDLAGLPGFNRELAERVLQRLGGGKG